MKERYVAIQFKHAFDVERWGDKEFHYKTYLKDLQEGDLVVVETQYGYAVAKVARSLIHSDHAHKYVIQKVDLSEHEKYVEKEMKLSFIQAEIDERVEEFRKRKELEALAAEDEKVKALLAEMDDLLS